MATWVGITIVPSLARRTSLRWLAYQVDYRLTREGIIYLGAVFVLILAAINTGNNLLFLILALPARRDSGFRHSFAHRAHRHRAEIRFARARLRRAAGARRTRAAQRKADVAFVFAARGGRHQEQENSRGDSDAAGFLSVHSRVPAPRAKKSSCVFRAAAASARTLSRIRTRFPFGFFEKTRQIEAASEIVVYPSRRASDQFYEVCRCFPAKWSVLCAAGDTSCIRCANT